MILTDQQRTDWLAGRWIAVRPYGGMNYVVRRLVKGQVEDNGTFFTPEKAQKWADKLNAREAKADEQPTNG